MTVRTAEELALHLSDIALNVTMARTKRDAMLCASELRTVQSWCEQLAETLPENEEAEQRAAERAAA